MNNNYPKVTNLTETLEYIYLDWFNNFVSAGGFASYYGLNITEEESKSLLHVARCLYNRNHE